MKQFFSLITFVVITTSSFGQELPKTESIEAIKKLSFLVGNWHGSGWFKFNEVKDSLAITQTITIIDLGVTFQMEMASELLLTQTQVKTTVHVNYDEKNKTYLTSATSMGSTSNGQAMILNDHTLQCNFVVNNGMEYRYIYSVVNNSETVMGEVTSDNGSSWKQIFGGTLSK